jgi:lipoate-protein ligase B
VACGLADSGVTSLRQASGREADPTAVEAAVCAAFVARFGYDAVVEGRA